MSVRLRLFLMWLLMAAIPLQGLAAASMLFCAAATHDAKVQASHVSASVWHDHSSHVHAGPVAKQTAGLDKAPDATHECGLCAACCHSIAVTEPPAIAARVLELRIDLLDPFLLIASQPSSIPDKPPRV
jgi:hypothetical protein